MKTKYQMKTKYLSKQNITNKILKYFDSIQYDKNKKLVYFYQDLFLPIFLFLEYICYVNVWKKFVIKELLTNDEIVSFLDRNEFGYIGNKLWKKDIIEKDSILDTFNPEEAEFNIQSEFVNAFTEIIQKNTNIDIENYITLRTKIEFSKIDGVRNHIKIYTIEVLYYRYLELQRKLSSFKYWLLMFYGIIMLLIFLPNLIIYFK